MYYLARRVVQVGLFAMIWAILGLVAFIFMPKVCSLFDMTLGTIYTHVSIFQSSSLAANSLNPPTLQVIFDTLQSRHREVVPEHIAENGQLDRTLTAEVRVTELTCIIRP